MQIVALSLKVGAVATLAMLPVAFALAWFLARAKVPGKILIEAIVYLPLVVPPEKLDAWLDPEVITDPLDLVDDDELTAWAETIEIRPVSRAVSNVRNDGPELLEPVPNPEWFDAG